MASRELRRIQSKKNQDKKTDVEVKREKRPILYGFSVAIIALVAIAFLFTMVPNSGSQNGANIVFGTYMGKEIKYMPDNYFAKYQSFLGEQLKNQSQGQEEQDYRTLTYQAWRGAFDQTVRHVAIEEKLSQSGYHISEDRVLNTIIKSYYLDENGVFDKGKYEETAPAQRDSTRKYILEQLIDATYQEDINYSQKIGKKEIDFYKQLASIERNFNVVIFSNANFPNQKVVEYATKNKDQFRKMNLSKITLKTEKEANDIKEKIASGQQSFEDAAKTVSVDNFREKGGSMGMVYYYELFNQLKENTQLNTKEAADAVFVLKPGSLSVVINLGAMWIIFRSDTAAEDLDLTKEDNIKMVRENYLNRYAQDILTDYTNQQANSFKEKVAATGFEKACKEIGQFPIHETEFFPMNYRNIQPFKQISIKGDKAPSIAAVSDNEQFFQVAFSLKENELSEPMIAGENTIILKMISEKTLTEEEWNAVNNQYMQYLQYMQYSKGDYRLLDYGTKAGIPASYLFTFNTNIDRDQNSKLVVQDKLKDDFTKVFEQAIMPEK